MNKAVFAIAIIVLLVVLGVPPVIGAFTERRLKQHAETIQTTLTTPYRLDVVDYKGGWFSSTARIDARLSDDYVEHLVAAAMQGEDDNTAAIARFAMRAILGQSMPLEIEVGHGPVFMNGGVQLGIVSTVVQPDPTAEGMPELLQFLGMPYLFEARTVTAVNGDTNFALNMPAIDFQAPQGRVGFSGLDVEGEFDLSARAVESAGTIDFLRVDAGPEGAMEIDGITLDSDIALFNSGLWLGDIDLEVSAINVEGVKAGAPFNIALNRAGAEFDSEVDNSGELVTMAGAYYLDSLTSDGLADVGAQLALADARFNASVTNYSIEALKAYYEYSQLVAANPRSAPPLIPGIQDMLYLTLSTSPDIEIGPLEFVWNDEPFVATATIDMDNSNLPARDEFNMLDFRTLLGAITITASTDLSEEMAQAIARQSAIFQLHQNATATGSEIPSEELDMVTEQQSVIMLLSLVSQGMLIATDEGYHSALLFENGELTVNGNPIPLPVPVF